MLNRTCLGAGTTGTSSFREDCDCDLTALMADTFLRKHFREQQSHYQYERTILFAKLIFMAGSPMMTSLKILLPLFSFSQGGIICLGSWFQMFPCIALECCFQAVVRQKSMTSAACGRGRSAHCSPEVEFISLLKYTGDGVWAKVTFSHYAGDKVQTA